MLDGSLRYEAWIPELMSIGYPDAILCALIKASERVTTVDLDEVASILALSGEQTTKTEWQAYFDKKFFYYSCEQALHRPIRVHSYSPDPVYASADGPCGVRLITSFHDGNWVERACAEAATRVVQMKKRAGSDLETARFLYRFSPLEEG